MGSFSDSIIGALTLTCRIRVPRKREPDYQGADFWLPVVGILAGLAALTGWGLGSLLFRGTGLPVLCSLALQYSLFNLLHLEGLSKSADAGMALAAPARRLEMQQDPRLGTRGLFAAFLDLAVRTAALATLGSGRGLAATLLAAPVAGRFAAVLVPLIAKPARPEGPAANMGTFSPMAAAAGLLAGLVPAFLACVFSLPGELGVAAGIICLGVGALTAGLVAGIGTAVFYRRRFGGFTESALGAAVETGELLFLLGAVAFTGWIV